MSRRAESSSSPEGAHSSARRTTSANAEPKPATAHPDIITDFLARKQAVLQTLLARFPVLPRLIAVCAAYCAVACLCIVSLIVLFVGSFVLTGHDRVVARLRWLFELVRTGRGQGLAGRGLAAVWWLWRLAGGLVAAAATAATGAAAPNGTHPSQGAGARPNAGRDGQRRASSPPPHYHQRQQQQQQQQQQHARRERSRTYASGSSSGAGYSYARTRPSSSGSSYAYSSREYRSSTL
ncbi:hypothetical protein THASP1DRAFT_29307 [Thamnocephalis sphaerospora]|uniref:Uncharacterized protein n=1 Tax=Thamnocephalis sphaerospora TaxID=78915 RepID=A0A4P9XS12_9FUNG|nr:hypothetical protein THASP1DRAFT_29307 [Thamnocephalis sphaerospora]|eukprot:RKP08897.1 hypothetical protein THASP1DRAFT_29307 [Thamnocephalis sphaerospora]